MHFTFGINGGENTNKSYSQNQTTRKLWINIF
jgi:hypothetical protein